MTLSIAGLEMPGLKASAQTNLLSLQMVMGGPRILPGEEHRCGEFSYLQIIIQSAFQTCNLWGREITNRFLRDERVGIRNLFQPHHPIFMFLPFILRGEGTYSRTNQ